MDDTRIMYKDGGIRQRDGYLGEPIWRQPDNDSTYYNSELDSQCAVPSKSLREIKEELGMTGTQ